MRIFIPTIGTQLKLTQNWKFSLYPEERNEVLGQLFDSTFNKKGWDFYSREYLKSMSVDFRQDWLKNRKKDDKKLESARKRYGVFVERTDADYEVLLEQHLSFREMETRNYIERYGAFPVPLSLTFPAGTILKVDRIYIRQGAEDFDSISFWAESPALFKSKKKQRFWAKLEDVNRMECDVI